jgi:membrane protease YdiL (CAAX protease family)
MQDIASLKRWFAILIAGIIFGLAHFAEGPIGILANASFGIFFGWVFVKSSRNLWITIIGHGILNTMRFIILFYGLN